jgi:hypothetical protein
MSDLIIECPARLRLYGWWEGLGAYALSRSGAEAARRYPLKVMFEKFVGRDGISTRVDGV